MFIRRITYAVLSILMLLSSSLVFVPIAASAASFQGDACAGVNALDNTASKTCADSSGSVSRIVKLVLNILSVIVGITAVIMVILGGFKFITSNGDSSKIASARTTILYAIVGLVVVALSQVMVHFVLANTNAAINNCKTTTCTSHN